MSKVIGIDLGTTFSAIASLDDLGNPEVLASIEDNRKITASAVYLKDNEVIVGDKALNYLKDQPWLASEILDHLASRSSNEKTDVKSLLKDQIL